MPLAALPALRRLGAAVATMRHRSLVLIYHRVTSGPRSALEIVPVVSPSTLRAHLDTLQEFADVTSLDAVLSGEHTGRLRVAITFDDDDLSHVEHALPVLASAGVRATFFLSGRALHGLPDYWWAHLEQALMAHGVGAVAAALEVTGNISRIASACEDPRVAERLSRLAVAPSGRQLAAADIAQLTGADMTIGFHTLGHPVLCSLRPSALNDALTHGRARLEQAAGTAIHYVAYPHGRADARVALAAKTSGYRAGFIAGGRAVSRDVDPFLIPRWEPGQLTAAQLATEALLRLHAPVGPGGAPE
jgi:peptidoglycan/xylan/chitin deacetylase (PgdA/CDA1 family)